MLIKVVALQGRLGRPLTLEEKILVFKQRPDFLCLPEYWQFDDTITDYQRAALRGADHLDYLIRLSDELATCVVGGTLVQADREQLFNTSYVIDRGRVLGSYRKRHPVPREQEKGISAGDSSVVIEVEGVRIGMLVCGDVFFPERYRELRTINADVIVIPTTSAYRPDDSLSRKRHRDRVYFLEGARAAGAYVVKVCGVGTIFDRPLQGRSLIAAPWRILERVDSSREQLPCALSATLSIDELREFRARDPEPQPNPDRSPDNNSVTAGR